MTKIKLYHAHLYYSSQTIEEAKILGECCYEKFALPLGRFHEKPVGPHPVWSCQISVPPKDFGDVIPWLAINRGNVDVFVHPVTGDDLVDHTKFVMWLGKSYDLKIEMFRNS